MPLAGFTVQKGELDFPLVVLSGTVGALGGILVLYCLGRQIGEQHLRQWIDRHGRWLSLSSNDVDRSKKWFERHGSSAVFFGRFVPGIRTYISLPAGFGEMPLLPFMLYSASGTAIWVGLLTYAGYALGQNYQLVEKYLGTASLVMLLAVAVGIAVWVTRRRLGRNQEK